MGLELTIEEESVKEGKLLRLDGRLDATTSPFLETTLERLSGENHKKILLDFSRVNYLSSAGMRLLLAYTKRLKGGLILFSIHEDAMEIIKMAGFERILNIHSGEKEALGS